jgi:HK97 family phage portal protein
LPSQYVEIDAKYTKRGAGLINKFKLNVFEDVNFQPDQILHIKTPNYSYENGEWLYGQSPLKAGLRTLNLSNSTTDAMTKQAQNQGALGLMMYDVNGNDGQTITPEQLRAFKAELHKAVAGTENRGRAVALSRMFKWQQLGMTAADMQLIEDHNLTRSDLCALYDLSSILFNDNAASTFNNVQEAKKSAYTEAIIPAAKTYIDGFNRDIIQKVDPDLYLSLDTGAIEVLKKDNAALISTLQNAWWLPTSKKQKMVGMEPDGTLPEYLLPMNLIPVDQLTDEAMAEIEQRAQSDPEVAKQYSELAKKYKDYFNGV